MTSHRSLKLSSHLSPRRHFQLRLSGPPNRRHHRSFVRVGLRPVRRHRLPRQQNPESPRRPRRGDRRQRNSRKDERRCGWWVVGDGDCVDGGSTEEREGDVE